MDLQELNMEIRELEGERKRIEERLSVLRMKRDDLTRSRENDWIFERASKDAEPFNLSKISEKVAKDSDKADKKI